MIAITGVLHLQCTVTTLGLDCSGARLGMLYRIIYKLSYYPEDTFKLRACNLPIRCSHHLELEVPFARSNSYFYSFVPHTTSLWNSLPKDTINASSSYPSFMYNLRSQYTVFLELLLSFMGSLCISTLLFVYPMHTEMHKVLQKKKKKKKKKVLSSVSLSRTCLQMSSFKVQCHPKCHEVNHHVRFMEHVEGSPSFLCKKYKVNYIVIFEKISLIACYPVQTTNY